MTGILPSLRKARSKALNTAHIDELHSDSMIITGKVLAGLNRSLVTIESLRDVEFRVFSQWGEDGIIDWLISRLPGIPDSFIEFGVEQYTEANTRFLLKNRNWRGFVMDGSEEYVALIKSDAISWRHDLTAKRVFIDASNVNKEIIDAGFDGEIGLLSVDIDGNDYWVWEAINCISPWIVIAEYNSAFGDVLPLSVPYDPSFVRGAAHHSNLYYGASIEALRHLGAQKGYTVVGANAAGSNVFFVRNDLAGPLLSTVADRACPPSRFREGRNSAGQLTLVTGTARTSVVGDLPVVNVVTNEQSALKNVVGLYSATWEAHLHGRLGALRSNAAQPQGL